MTLVHEAVQLLSMIGTLRDIMGLPAAALLQQRSATLTSRKTSLTPKCLARFQRMKELEEENNRLFIEAFGLQDELSPEVPEDQITLYRPDREEDIKRLISYAIGCMMGRYSLDKPDLIYAHSGNKGFDPSQYQTFPADDDGIIPLLGDRLVPRRRQPTAWSSSSGWPGRKNTWKRTLSSSPIALARIATSSPVTPSAAISPRVSTSTTCPMYKRRPIYWLFSSGKQRAFQCLVYLHRYHEGTLSRMRTEYVIPLQGKIASRIGQLADDIAAASSTSHRKRLEKERDTLVKQHTELHAFDEQLRHYADQRISLDLDDGVKVNYGKFGDLLAEVKAVTGGIEET